MDLFNDFSIGLFVWQTVLFLALLFLLRKYAWKPILSAVEEREEGIKNALEAADNAKKRDGSSSMLTTSVFCVKQKPKEITYSRKQER